MRAQHTPLRPRDLASLDPEPAEGARGVLSVRRERGRETLPSSTPSERRSEPAP